MQQNDAFRCTDILRSKPVYDVCTFAVKQSISKHASLDHDFPGRVNLEQVFAVSEEWSAASRRCYVLTHGASEVRTPKTWTCLQKAISKYWTGWIMNLAINWFSTLAWSFLFTQASNWISLLRLRSWNSAEKFVELLLHFLKSWSCAMFLAWLSLTDATSQFIKQSSTKA